MQLSVEKKLLLLMVYTGLGSNKKAYSNAVESMEHKQFKAIFKGQEKKNVLLSIGKWLFFFFLPKN